MKKIQFDFKQDLPHQTAAVEATKSLFEGLPKQVPGIYANVRKMQKLDETGEIIRNPEIIEGKRLIENLNKVQLNNELFADSNIMSNDFTIEMETGTGKTYVYLKTMLELYKEYKFTKFIIVVPSVAIRLGVEQSIKQLTEHFKGLYNIDLSKYCFTYNSDNLSEINTKLIETKELSICIMNIQAFNSSNNKIRQEDEYGKVIWDDIRLIRPILIIDEPQKLEGTAKKKSKSLQALEELNPLFTLRYSATHKQLHHQIYKLDSYDAYNQDLVKKIIVKTINAVIPKDTPFVRYVEFTKDLRAKIEIFSQEQGGYIKFKKFNVRGGDSLFDLSGGLPQYENIRIHEDPHKLETLKIAFGSEIKQLSIGQSTNDVSNEDAIRIQIQLTIKSHFEKQFSILEQGKEIKALSLFFIDAVQKVRDTTVEDGRGEYLKIFDQEYEKFISDPVNQAKFEQYKQFFARYDEVNVVREGYFAMDKKKTIVEVDGWDESKPMDEIKLKAKTQQDIDRGIDLILRKKDELISFNEPLSFIFSHSALREGWDNPNIFTLCTLKSSGSDIAKKQEIGRGLRLAVDVQGQRITEPTINELTVIANDNYDHFAELLQKDFNEGTSFNKDEVTADVLIETLKAARIPKKKITPAVVNAFRDELQKNNIISPTNILTKSANEIQNIEFENELLSDFTEHIKEQFVKQMVKKGTRKVAIQNGDNEIPENSMHSYVNEDDFAEILNNLTAKLLPRSMYHVEIDSKLFINDCIEKINEKLQFKKLKKEFEYTTARNEFDTVRRMQLVKESDAATLEMELLNAAEEKSELEIVNYIMHHTMLPRMAILKIVRGMTKKSLLSNQDILEDVTKLIQENLQETKASAFKERNGSGYYTTIEGYELDSVKIYALDNIIDEKMLEKEHKDVYITNVAKRKAVNKFYRTDSDGEYDFAQNLENNPNVLLFTKLKKGGFIIDTPYGDYSPDWAIVFKNGDDVSKLYFIAETKIGKNWSDLDSKEQVKINCGIKHFEAVSGDIRFDWVKDYNDFKTKSGLKDTI